MPWRIEHDALVQPRTLNCRTNCKQAKSSLKKLTRTTNTTPVALQKKLYIGSGDQAPRVVPEVLVM